MEEKRYKIEIKSYVKVVQARKEWRQVRVDPDPQARVFEYVEDEWPQTVERTLLLQEVEEIDIPAVIAAINNM